MSGFKASYMVLFFAIVDSINRNSWHPVHLPYDYIINKCRIDKEVYLKGRKWLSDNCLLEVEPGKNNYQMAKFGIGLAVGKSTGIPTGEGTSTPPAQPPAQPPIIKPETDKLENLKQSFDQFWNNYEKKVGKEKAFKEWTKLTDDERQKATARIDEYKSYQPDVQFRKDPERYLKLKTFNDEFILTKSKLNGNAVIPAFIPD